MTEVRTPVAPERGRRRAFQRGGNARWSGQSCERHSEWGAILWLLDGVSPIGPKGPPGGYQSRNDFVSSHKSGSRLSGAVA